jgi:septal ring factor EnvC (AmiA/AmiB activator)
MGETMKQTTSLFLVLVFSSFAYAQEAPVLKTTWREKTDALQAKLDESNSERMKCTATIRDKTEEMGLLKMALTNADKDRLLAEGRLAGVRETVDRLEKENTAVRQKNNDLEFALARYSWAVTGEALTLVAMTVILIIISFRLRKRRPQS